MPGDLKKLLASFDLRSLGRFRHEITGVIALVALSFLFYRFAYLHNRAEMASISAGIDNKRSETTRIEAEVRSAEGLDRAVAEATRNLAVLEKRLSGLAEKLPSDRHISMLLAEFSGSGPGEIRIVAIKPLAPEEKGELARLPFQITVESRYMPLGNYIEKIENLPRLMVVDNVTIEPREEGSTLLSSNIYLSAFVAGYPGGQR